VETSGVWDLLSMLGCDTSQGYLMGRPMSADQLEAFLRKPVAPPMLVNALYAT
jgi:EAL domain-containing protein (putative c-di-GMP-specific phosphodiesterase class I)